MGHFLILESNLRISHHLELVTKGITVKNLNLLMFQEVWEVKFMLMIPEAFNFKL
jgi:hypothetical protein